MTEPPYSVCEGTYILLEDVWVFLFPGVALNITIRLFIKLMC